MSELQSKHDISGPVLTSGRPRSYFPRRCHALPREEEEGEEEVVARVAGRLASSRRVPAAPEITVRGTWCACGMRLSHPNEEVRGFLCMRACVKESGGGEVGEGEAKREGTGNSQEQNIQLFVTFLRLIPP